MDERKARNVWRVTGACALTALTAALAACGSDGSSSTSEADVDGGFGGSALAERGAEGSAGGPGAGGGSGPAGEGSALHEPSMDDVFKGLRRGEDQRQALCARGGVNRVTTAFCAEPRTAIGSLKDLQGALGLAFTAGGGGPRATGPAFALTGHSSSLVARFVNALNPRALVFSAPGVGGRSVTADFVAMGFARGEQVVELVARDTEKGVLRFFLVAFHQACNDVGCSVGELLTPAVEKDWKDLTVYEDVDLANTTMDCTHCHQPGGVGTPRMLRFQELRNPWTHFFRANTTGGRALLQDFHGAHGAAEDYGPIPAGLIDASEPQDLEDLVQAAGSGAQPNEFPTRTIEQEVQRSSPGQPASNATPGTSATWSVLYQRFAQGLAIAPPYHDVKVTDPTKVGPLSAAYREFLAGTRPANQVPDLRDAFLTDAAWRMGFAPKPEATGKEILVQMCQSCHNGTVDPTLGRARFDVSRLDAMSRGEKDVAISRLTAPPGEIRLMPPSRFRSLSSAEIQRAVDELRK